MTGIKSLMWIWVCSSFDRFLRLRLASELPAASAEAIEMLIPRHLETKGKSEVAAANRSTHSNWDGGSSSDNFPLVGAV